MKGTKGCSIFRVWASTQAVVACDSGGRLHPLCACYRTSIHSLIVDNPLRLTDFTYSSAYSPGDDVRYVDWNIFARTNEPVLKLYKHEEEMHVVLLVDGSQSMQFEGKFDLARRLAAARLAALERQHPEPAPAWKCADNVLGRLEGWGGLSLRVLVPLALLLAGAVAIYAWQQNQRLAELEEIDAQLLSDELPIDAYLDRGFQSWLKKRAAEP